MRKVLLRVDDDGRQSYVEVFFRTQAGWCLCDVCEDCEVLWQHHRTR